MRGRRSFPRSARGLRPAPHTRPHARARLSRTRRSRSASRGRTAASIPKAGLRRERRARRRNRKRRHPVDLFARDVEAFAAGREDAHLGTRPQQHRRDGSHFGDDVFAVVEDEQQALRRRYASSVSSSGRLGVSCTPSAWATALATSDGSLSGASSTSHTPSPEPSNMSAPACTAQRVLPAPPVPTSVTSGDRATSRCSPTRLRGPRRR